MFTCPYQPMQARNKVFLEHSVMAYDIMINSHRPPLPSDECISCLLRHNRRHQLPNVSARYRCQDCLQHPDLCLDCVTDLHVFNPTHTIWKWDVEEELWRKTTLTQATGHVINLGHNGKACPTSWRDPYAVLIVHEHGMHTIPIRFCGCRHLTEPWKTKKAYQLLAHGLFPGSWDNPRSAFTLPLLRGMDLLLLQTQTSILSLSKYLQRLTDNVNAIHAPVR